MRTLFIPALALTAAAPAFAQDATAPFSGPHIEAIGGWDRSQADGGHRDGVLYGVGAGYDIQRGSMVFGVDAEANDSSAKACSGAATAASPRLCAKAARDLYVGGRVGTLVTPTTLLYAKAGYTNGRYKATVDTGTGSNSLGADNLDGVRVGLGVEHALGSKAFIRTEYRYSNYQDGVSRNQVVAGVGMHF